MDINKTPNLFVGDAFVHVLVSQKEHCCSFLLSCVAWVRGGSLRWLSCASPHSPWGKIWEARGRSNGGDIRRGHPVFSLSCLGFPSWRMLTCVSITGHPHQRRRRSFRFCNHTDRTNHTKPAFSPWPGGLLVVKTSEANDCMVGWLVGWCDSQDGRELKEC